MNAALFVSLFAWGVSFYSCEKDDAYNPKRKISKIYADVKHSTIEWDEDDMPTVTETFRPKQLIQSWTWDNDKLSKVDFYDTEDENGQSQEPTNTSSFFYDNNKLVKIEKSDGAYSNILYDGDILDKIESYYDTQLLQTVTFSYDKKKISKIHIVIPISDDKKMKRELLSTLSTFIPKEVVSIMAKKGIAKSSGETALDIYYTYKGDNISKMVCEAKENGLLFNNLKLTVNYLSYDTKHNPFYKKLGTDVNIESSTEMAVVQPKNNPLEVKMLLEGDLFGIIPQAITAKYSYTYDKGFPTVVEVKVNDYSDVLKQYYEYK